MAIPRQPKGVRWLFSQTTTFDILIAAFASVIGLSSAASYASQNRQGSALMVALATVAVLVFSVVKNAMGLRQASKKDSIHELEGCLHTLHAVLDPSSSNPPVTLRLGVHVPVGDMLERQPLVLFFRDRDSHRDLLSRRRHAGGSFCAASQNVFSCKAGAWSRRLVTVKVSKFLAAALGAALGLLPIGPPEHLHEGEEHGHVHIVIHRHPKPHGLLEHHAEHHSTVGDDDGPALILTTIYTVPAGPAVASPPQIVSAWMEPPTPRRVERLFADIDLLIHGPPRAPTPPRAPPLSPRV